MFGTVFGLPPRAQVAQSLRAHPVYALLDARPWPAEGEALPAPDGRPRLLIGRASTQRLLGRSFGPLETRVDPVTWWAYTPEEDATYFIRQFEDFLRQVPPALLEVVSWRGLDPLVHGPATGADLWRALTPAPGMGWQVFEHAKGWSWWDPAYPGQVSGLHADTYFAHCGITRVELASWLRARASRYVVDGRPSRVSLWFMTRFGYGFTDVVRVAPWLMHLKGATPI